MLPDQIDQGKGIAIKGEQALAKHIGRIGRRVSKRSHRRTNGE